MTAKKYEFVDGDTITIAPGRTLKRIRALVAIAATAFTPSVTPGDLGGYVESEDNLARVSGDAWVSGDARVSGDAWVYGDARVSGDAWVYGNAQVYGDARVYGDAWVSGDARVSGDAWVSGDARVSGDAQVSECDHVVWFSHVGSENGTLTVFNAKDDVVYVTRGCFKGTADEFLDKSAEVHDERIQHEYKLLIEVARSRIANA